VLEPAFEIVTRPSLPARGGEYVVEGKAADGSRVFSLNFTPDEIADDPQHARLFAFAVPLLSQHAARVATIRLAGRGREVVSTRTVEMPQPGSRVQPISVRRTAGGQVSVEWDAAAHPMLLVRDGSTGQILSFARGGSIQLPAGHRELSVAFSNRVQSRDVRLSVPSR
jgi:hypothetical protein